MNFNVYNRGVNAMEFSINEIVSLVRKKIIYIVLSIILGMILFFLVSKFVIKPSYTSTSLMYVNPNYSSSVNNMNDLNYAQKVLNTYINFLQTNEFYKEVLEQTNLEYTSSQLKEMTSINNVNNTEIFNVSVTTQNPLDSYKLAVAMQETIPQFIKEIKYTCDVSLVDAAVLPTAASSPNILNNTFVGGAVGLFISIFIIFCMEILNNKVKNYMDLQEKSKIPILGVVPRFNNIKTKKGKQRRLKFEEIGKEEISKIVAEAYKSFRVNLFVSLRKKSCKKVAFCSCDVGDGKSTTVVNLAITVAQTEAKVLIIDCDLRRGSLHQFFNIKNVPGISDYLAGLVEKENLILNTSYLGVDIIPRGSVFSNPAELLSSTSYEKLIEELEAQYDYIFIDTPPLDLFSDTLHLSKLIDGVVVVVRERTTTYTKLFKAIEQLKFTEVNILGMVLNDVCFEKQRNKYKHYYNKEGNSYD